MKKNIIIDKNATVELDAFNPEVRDAFDGLVRVLWEEGRLAYPDARKVASELFEMRIMEEGAYRGFYAIKSAPPVFITTMNNKRSDKIQKAIDRGDLIPYEDIWNSYSKERQERIMQKVRYLRAAMELRRLRRSARISQEKLAKKMRVKREFISRAESGRQNITLDTLYRFGAAMGKELYLTFK